MRKTITRDMADKAATALTQPLREAYKALTEELKTKVYEYLIARLPYNIKNIYAGPGNERQYLNRTYDVTIRLGDEEGEVRVYLDTPIPTSATRMMGAMIYRGEDAKVEPICQIANRRKNLRVEIDELDTAIRRSLYGLRSVAKIRKVMPEAIQYMDLGDTGQNSQTATTSTSTEDTAKEVMGRLNKAIESLKKGEK